MFDAVSFLFSSLSRRLRLRRWKERITSSAATDRVPLFSCGGGCDGTTPFVKSRKTLGMTAKEAKTSSGRIDGKVHVDADDEPCVWRRTILLGRRCQPLEFPGAIHYDSEGKMLLQARSPPASPARSFDLGYVDRA
ncbi:hypothetical protein ABZP36_015457 [Zizania latifolia]